MRIVDIIVKKRDGQELNREEIQWFVKKYTQGDIPDYQAAALLMAICIRGMSREETVTLTLAMAESGQMLDLSDITDYAVDKHSSGGVGDKTSFVVLPLVAACGVPVAKMSGRGLGFTGGTLDKIESIAGYTIQIEETKFREIAKRNGIVLAGQTAKLAPADGKLYALRDVTGTVESLPLIASSIMSKKLAAGANGIVLDVKAGRGAFMKSVESARELAQMMVNIGVDAGRDMVALLSDMNQPLGRAVGNALEVKEAIDTLQGGGPADFKEHCLIVAKYMLKLAGRGKKWIDEEEILALLNDNLTNGEAYEKFKQMIAAQGGDIKMVDDPSLLPKASIVETYTAQESGYIAEVDAIDVAQAALILGAGREKKGDPIDLAVGVIVHVNVGDAIQQGDTLFTLHANDAAKATEARTYLESAIQYSSEPVDELPLFYDVIESGKR